ncbi:hypothetical protein MNBD_ACTINO02-1008 [hydrothermal vent metagenome]|uniref:Uncharacterized protein n=1 Tax=hydrothermal vent metagenome TaxID=652676 RepID=A0A3B0SRD6_9ZZZZ
MLVRRWSMCRARAVDLSDLITFNRDPDFVLEVLDRHWHGAAYSPYELTIDNGRVARSSSNICPNSIR